MIVVLILKDLVIREMCHTDLPTRVNTWSDPIFVDIKLLVGRLFAARLLFVCSYLVCRPTFVETLKSELIKIYAEAVRQYPIVNSIRLSHPTELQMPYRSFIYVATYCYISQGIFYM